MVQAELSLAVLAQQSDTGRFILMRVPTAVPLHWVDRGTAECLFACLTEDLNIPGWRELAAKCDLRIDTSCSDRASANDKTESCMFQHRAIPRLRLPCYIHCCSTAQGRSFKCMDQDLSGIIAASLAQRATGSTTSFREQLVHVLEASVVPLDAPVPDSSEPRMQYRDSLLSLTLPDTPAGRARAARLRVLLTGDLQAQRIDFHAPGRVINKHKWATHVAEALLPEAIPLFPRQRWCNSLESVGAYALLANTHSLLSRAGIRWLRHQAGKEVPDLLAGGVDVEDDIDADAGSCPS